MAIPLCHMISMPIVHPTLKIDILKMEQHFRLAIGKGTKFLMCHFSIKRGRRNSNSNTCLFGVNIGCMKMRDLSLSCLPILTSSLSLGACFCVGWESQVASLVALHQPSTQ
jgi:hypothetical protein